MKLARRLILLIALLAVGLWLWSSFFPSPQKAIRRHLEKTARAASFKATEGDLELIGNIAEFGKCFSKDVEVQFETPGGGSQTVTGRKDLMGAARMARIYTGALQVEFLDSILTIAPDQQTAMVDLTVRARIPGDRDFFVQEMKLHLKKFGRAWLIIRAETVKTLSREGDPRFPLPFGRGEGQGEGFRGGAERGVGQWPPGLSPSPRPSPPPRGRGSSVPRLSATSASLRLIRVPISDEVLGLSGPSVISSA